MKSSASELDLRAPTSSTDAAPGRASPCTVSNSSQAELTSLYIMKYILVKPVNEWSITTTFSTPLQTNAADGINFRGKTTNSGVTHAIVCLLIEIDL